MAKIEELTDEQLAAARAREHARLTPRAAQLVLLLAAGKSLIDAARVVGYAEHASTLSRLKDRVEPALALMREEARRTAVETAESAAKWFDEVAAEARKEKDYSAAARHKREACLLRGFYPDPKLRIEHELVDARTITPEELEALARLRHEVRPQLEAANCVVDATAIEVAPEPLREEDLSDVLC